MISARYLNFHTHPWHGVAARSLARQHQAPKISTRLTNGLHNIASETPECADYGVAFLHDGKLRCGDSGIAYSDDYWQEGQAFSSELLLTQHRRVPGALSAMKLHGLVDTGSEVRVKGASPRAAWCGSRFGYRRSRTEEFNLTQSIDRRPASKMRSYQISGLARVKFYPSKKNMSAAQLSELL